MNRSRGWCITINNPTDEDLADLILLADGADYLVCGDEIGDQGTPHEQCYVYFENAHTFTSVTKQLPRARIVPAKGSPQQNFEYCTKKDAPFIEFGECPTQGRASMDKIKDAMADPESNFHVYQQYKKTYKEYQRSIPKDHQRQLYVCDTDLRYDFAKKFPSVLFNSPLDSYDGEDAIFLHYPSGLDMDLDDWMNGMIHKIRRGYELIPLDPRVVVIFLHGEVAKNLFNKKYLHIIDKWFFDPKHVERFDLEDERDLSENAE